MSEIIETNIQKTTFELLEEIKTAKGLARVVALRKINTKIQSGEKFFIKFSIELIEKE